MHTLRVILISSVLAPALCNVSAASDPDTDFQEQTRIASFPVPGWQGVRVRVFEQPATEHSVQSITNLTDESLYIYDARWQVITTIAAMSALVMDAGECRRVGLLHISRSEPGSSVTVECRVGRHYSVRGFGATVIEPELAEVSE